MSDASLRAALPVGSMGKRASGWWGMLTIVMTEAALFSYLLFSYFYFAVQYGRGFLPDELPKFKLSLPNTIILVASSFALAWGERAIRRGERRKLLMGLGLAILLGALFVVVQVFEWRAKPFTYASSSYGSLFFIITGFHMAHVLVGLVMLVLLFIWSVMGLFDRRRNAPITIGGFYWHFVDVVWLCVFFSLYVTPYLG